jgi:phenylacetate-CoA ligase
MMYETVEQQRAAHYAYLNSQVMPEMLARLKWTRAQIEVYRTQAFRELLRHAKAHSSWYAQRLAHIDPAIATMDDLVRIPPMNKNDLMDHWDEIVTIPGACRREAEEALQRMTDQSYIWEDKIVLASGGSSGRPGVFVYDWTEFATIYAGMGRGFLAPLVRQVGGDVMEKIRIASIAAEKSAHGSYVLNRVFSNPKNPTHRLSAWRSIGNYLNDLNEIQPHFLFCYPSTIPELAAATYAGELKIDPRVIYVGAEQLSDAGRELAHRTWPQADILTCWGTSEGGGTFPCPSGEGFHISEDLVVIEPIDGDGNPVGRGQLSAGIYFTNLFCKSLPIIRYFIDDIFEMDDTPCACGSAFQKVRQVHGRSLELFHYGDIAVLPATLELAVLEQPNICEYQIRQTPDGAHIAYRSKGDIDDARLIGKMRQSLQSFGLSDPVISVERAAMIERTKAGKMKRFVPLPH